MGGWWQIRCVGYGRWVRFGAGRPGRRWRDLGSRGGGVLNKLPVKGRRGRLVYRGLFRVGIGRSGTYPRFSEVETYGCSSKSRWLAESSQRP